MTERHLRTMKIDSHLSPPLDGGGSGWGWTSKPYPPHLNPLPPRGEEAFCGVTF